MNWWDVINPFTNLGNAAASVVADGWTMAMLGLWNAGLWLLKLVLGIEDVFLTPDLSERGPMRGVYPYTFWVAGALVLILLMIQLGVAAFRRDGRALARVLIGAGQFVMVWVAWIGYAVVVLAAASGLTRALMTSLLHVDSMDAWQPWSGFDVADITDGTIATVLGVLGLLPGLRRDRAPAGHARPWGLAARAVRDQPRSPRPGWCGRAAGPGSGSRSGGSTPPRSPRC